MDTMDSMERDVFVFQPMLTCIGNKRKLLPFIEEAVVAVKDALGKTALVVMDAFAGSTVVARMLTYHAMTLYTNDLEEYSKIMCDAFLRPPTDAQALRVQHHIREMNDRAAHGPWVEGFVCELYAPQETDNIQEGERCFYTHENALRMDTMRAYIRDHVEACEPDLVPYVLAPLLVQASIHTNTSGVFKGFYKHGNVGCFGGVGKNALSRITHPIHVDMPVWRPHDACHTVCWKGDVLEALERLPQDSLDLIYMDPPYNQHPYGSNYFMLNLLADGRGPDPQKISCVSGIPHTWNKSAFNYRGSARKAMAHMLALGTQKARFLLISYNDEGLLEKEDWEDLLAPYHTHRYEQPYAAFRGSRNLGQRRATVLEVMYLVSAHPLPGLVNSKMA